MVRSDLWITYVRGLFLYLLCLAGSWSGWVRDSEIEVVESVSSLGWGCRAPCTSGWQLASGEAGCNVGSIW